MRDVAAVAVGLLAGCTTMEPDTASVEQPVAGTAVVSLTFDDTFADQQAAVDLLDERGLRGTFYVNSQRVSQAGYLTLGQLLDWQAQGHEIAGHTANHLQLPTLEPDDARRQVCNDRVALIEMGFAVTSFAYPFGASDALTEQIAEDCGYNSARGVGDARDTIPPGDPYDLHTAPPVTADTTLGDLQSYVIAAEPTGAWVPIVFHHVCDGCASNGVSPTTLADFLDWLETRGTLVSTVDEIIGGAQQPPVGGPPPAANLLDNASLEVDADGDDVPDCWQRGGTGTSTATFELIGNAPDGAVAQRITVTSIAPSSARRLVSRQDAGACAPAAAPGRAYRVSALYLANVQPRFTIYYRANGTWTFFTQSPLLPSSSRYIPASYVTPALPAGASAISVGLSLFSVGTITMDAFTLAESQTTP